MAWNGLCDCLIAGAGPTGLTLAIELRRQGLDVRLIDQNDHPAQHSQALGVQARTLEQMDRYGLSERAVAEGMPIRRAVIYKENVPQAELDLSRIPGHFSYMLVLPQNETEAILIDHLEALGVKIEREVTLEGLTEGTEGHGVVARLRHADGSLEEVRSRWLAGCDGAHSTVRRELGIGFDGDTSALKFALGDLRLSGRTVPKDHMEAHWHKGGQAMVMFPMRSGLHRIITVSHDEGGAPLTPPTVEEFNAEFERMGMEIRAEEAVWLAPFRVNERQVKSYRKGDVFLLGDAAHIHSPVGGQGMNTGMQDAANLAWKLAAVAKGAPAGLLDSYHDERHEVGVRVLRGSGLGLRAATSESVLVEGLRDFVMRHLVPLGWVQEAVGRQMSETAIGYRGSKVVMEEGGHGPLRAGDRMPDATRGEERLLAGLREAGHLLIAMDAAEVVGLQGVREVQVSSGDAGWSPGLDELLGEGPQIFLVRPDGYIGFHGKAGGEGLRRYAESVGLGFAG